VCRALVSEALELSSFMEKVSFSLYLNFPNGFDHLRSTNIFNK
jgi:hypothetical protein